MNSTFAPTVPIGRLEWDAAQFVLQGCSPQRQVRVLPYLLSLYSFMAWWENDAQALRGDPDRELSLTTTWCEQPEVLELIDVADLNIEGTQLAIYPVDGASSDFSLHCPTFLGVLNADRAVAVGLDRDRCWATLLGTVDRASLVQFWQSHPPDSHGNSPVPLDLLQSIYYLPEQLSYLHPTLPQANPKPLRKTNRNQLPIESDFIANADQLTEKLLQLGVVPPAVANGSGLSNPSLAAPDLPVNNGNTATVNRLVKALQVYRGESSQAKLLS